MTGLGWWHQFVRIVRLDPPPHFAAPGPLSVDDSIAIPKTRNIILIIQPQRGFAVHRILPVTLKAVLGQNRSDVPVEFRNGPIARNNRSCIITIGPPANRHSEGKQQRQPQSEDQ